MSKEPAPKIMATTAETTSSRMASGPRPRSTGVLAGLTVPAESSADTAGPRRTASRSRPLGPGLAPNDGDGRGPRAAAPDSRLPGRDDQPEVTFGNSPLSAAASQAWGKGKRLQDLGTLAEPDDDGLDRVVFSPAEPQLSPGAARAVLAMLLHARSAARLRGAEAGGLEICCCPGTTVGRHGTCRPPRRRASCCGSCCRGASGRTMMTAFGASGRLRQAGRPAFVLAGFVLAARP